MEVTYFLSKLLGVYMMVVGFGMLIHGDRVRALLLELVASPLMLFTTGFMALLFGSYIVAVHNVWEYEWPVMITIIGWVALVKGMVRVAFPDLAVKMLGDVLKNKMAYYVFAALAFLLGSFMMYMGYLHNFS